MKNNKWIISLITAAALTGLLAFSFLPQAEVEASITAQPAARIKTDDRFSPASIYDADAERLAQLSLPVSEKDFKCLAQAIYFEARSEPLEGQVAVAYVILNRVKDRRYPDNICGVVFQNENRRHLCQFSFACDGLSDNPYEMTAWNVARRIAGAVLINAQSDVTGRSTHYHAKYVSPRWAKHLQPTIQVGRHVFYREDL